MNSPELNNYIQYVTRSGIVKAKSVDFLDNGETTTFEVAGINEDFFIFGVFQNNLQRYGIGFENFDNINMLSFINSSIVDLACVPVYSFLSSEQVVTMSYNNAYVKSFTKSDSINFDFNLILAKLEEIRVCSCAPCSPPIQPNGIFTQQFNNTFN